MAVSALYCCCTECTFCGASSILLDGKSKMIDHSDILQLCRLCLVEEKVNHSIFEEAGGLRGIFLKITSCLPVSISQDDSLPKKICDSCSSKLDTFYQFWNETANAEKQLLQWLNQTTLGPISKAGQTETKHKMDSAEVKEEAVDVGDGGFDDMKMSSDAQTYVLQQQQLPYSTPSKVRPAEENNETEEIPPKRPRRASAIKALEHMGSEEEDDPDYDGDNYTKAESDDSEKDEEDDEDETYREGPSTSMDDQPGTSGMTKGSTETPSEGCLIYELPFDDVEIKQEPYDSDEEEQIVITVVSDFESDIDLQTVKLENDNYGVNGAKVSKIGGKYKVRDDSSDKEGKRSTLCHICGKKISRMIPHMRRHEKYLNCDECLDTFRTQRDLDKHKIYHENNKYPCRNCTLNFKTSVELCKHSIKHYGVYKCIFCQFSTSHVASIIVHVNRHEDNMKFRCDICGRGFNTEYVMESHKQIHTGIKKYQCDFCPKRFTTENYKKGHMKFNHSKELTGIQTVYKCEVCQRVFSFEKSLIRHLSVIHDIGVSKRVECPVCSKVIANNFNLKMHMTMHTGEKKHMCELCGKSFRDKAHLKRHYRVHSKRGEYMYV